jgi:hypothetical protein
MVPTNAKEVKTIPLDEWSFRVQVNDAVQHASAQADFVFRLNRHSLGRIHQRNISIQEIAFTLIYGSSFSLQGRTFTVLSRKMIPTSSDHRYERAEDLVVVLDDDRGEIKTCYRRKDAVSYVRRKLKYLPQKYRRSTSSHSMSEHRPLFQPVLDMPEHLKERKKREL